jgi:hypothetical protein
MTQFYLYYICHLYTTLFFRINPNIKSTVYCTGVAEGGIEEWSFIYNHYKKATVVSEKSLLEAALSCTKETWILNK